MSQILKMDEDWPPDADIDFSIQPYFQKVNSQPLSLDLNKDHTFYSADKNKSAHRESDHVNDSESIISRVPNEILKRKKDSSQIVISRLIRLIRKSRYS